MLRVVARRDIETCGTSREGKTLSVGATEPEQHEIVRAVARRLVAVLPAPPVALSDDIVAQTQWMELIAEAADGLIAVARGDADILRCALGAHLVVGNEPAWRVLLESALARCVANNSFRNSDVLSA